MSSSIHNAGYIRASSQTSDGERRYSLLGINDKNDDLNSPKTAHNGYVWGVVLFGAIGGLLFGMDQGNFGGTETREGFCKDFCFDAGWGSQDACQGLNGEEVPSKMTSFQGWGASLVPLGAAAGALLFAPLITGNLGRRAGLFIGSALITACMFWSLVVNNTSFLLSRFFTGVTVGIVTYSLPMWTAEVAPANIRGALGTTMQLATVIGSWVASGISIPDSVTWQWMIICPVVPAIILAIGIFFFPESPRFLYRKYGVDRARPTLQKLRQDKDVEEELMLIEQDIEVSTKQAPWSTLWMDPSIRKRVLLACGIQWMQQFTGVNALVSHGPKVYGAAGMDEIMKPYIATFIQNGFNLAGTIILLLIIDKYGRRTLLLLGAAIMFVFMLAAACISQFWIGTDGGIHKAAAWLLLASCCLYFIGFALAWGAIPWVYPSEIFPMDVKEKALSLSVANQWIANFVIAKIVPPQIDVWKPGPTFFFYAGFILLDFVLVYFFFPETKGIPLEEMDTLFGRRMTKQEDDHVNNEA